MKTIILCGMMLMMVGVLLSAESGNESMATNETVKHFEFKPKGSQEINYLLFLPQGYSKGEKQWPSILFLHGAGERGSDVWKVATHGPPKRVRKNPDFPFIVVSPQCPDGEIWSRNLLLALLDEIVKKYNVDESRVYLTGLSMGGYGAWDLGLSHPEKFAAIVPICGGGDYIAMLLGSRDKPEVLKSLGVWAFHGAKDPVVPVSESERMVDFLRKLGVKDVKLTVYPDAQHDSWTRTYENPELYEWLLQHQRKQK